MDEMVLKALGQIQKDMKELHGLMAAKKHGYKYPGFEDELKEFESEDMPEGEQDSIKFGEDEGQDPYDRGFEESFILGTGGGSHWNDKKALAPPQRMTYTRNGKEVEPPQDFYSSRNYTDSMIHFIDMNKSDKKPARASSMRPSCA